MQAQVPNQMGYAPAMQYVGVGSRFLAVLIDAIIVGIVAGIINVVVAGGSHDAATATTVSGSVFGALYIVYTIVMEGTMGATVGKLALGLRVVKEDGAPIGWGDSIIRNLLRIVDGLVAYLVGAIFIWNSPRKQRLGDRIAHTVVIKKQR